MATFFQFFRQKTNDQRLTNDQEFITLPQGTVLIKDNGNEYQKSGTNIYDKVKRDIYSANEANEEFVEKSESNTFEENNTFYKNLTVLGTTTTGSLHVTGNAAIDGNTTLKGNLNGVNITLTGKITSPNAEFTNVTVNTALNPKSNNTGSIGTSSLNWANAYITNIYGTINHAKYSDLAEKYSTDQDYPYGTVLQINTDGTSQMTKYKGGVLTGVIAQMPGFRMNADALDGQYVALKGMVPVLTYSDVKKGQFCIAIDGKVKGVDKTKMTLSDMLNCVGIALEDSANGYVLTKI